MSRKGNLLPNFIEAASPKGLRRLMFKTNVKDGAQNQYFDIQTHVDKRGRTRWIAWYYTDVGLKDMEDLSKGK